MDIRTTCLLVLAGSVTLGLSTRDVCLEFSFVEFCSNLGFFCHGTTLYSTHMTLPLCKLTCEHSASCAAINYNTSGDICVQKATPCHEALRKPFMQYFRFTQREPEACFHWQEMSSVNVADPRLVYNPENSRYVCRLVGPSAFVYPGYVERGNCWSGDKQRGMYSLDSNVVSEVLLVHPMCTIGWMPFVAKERPPSNSFSPGETAAGEMTYITRLFIESYQEHVFGYYTTESAVSYANFRAHQLRNTMDILVFIWISLLQIVIIIHSSKCEYTPTEAKVDTNNTDKNLHYGDHIDYSFAARTDL